MTKKNDYIFKKRIGRLWVTVFENLNQKSGEVYFSTYINRRYKNRDGHWVDAPFSLEDLEDDLPRAAQAAVNAIAEHKTKLSPQQLPVAEDPGLVSTVHVPSLEDAA